MTEIIVFTTLVVIMVIIAILIVAAYKAVDNITIIAIIIHEEGNLVDKHLLVVN